MSIPGKLFAAFSAPKMVLAALFVFFLAAANSVAGAASHPAKLSDGSGAYATGKYANLFAEEGHPQKEISAKIQTRVSAAFSWRSRDPIHLL